MRRRTTLTVAAVAVTVGILGAKLVDIQVVHADKLQQESVDAKEVSTTLLGTRGSIVERFVTTASGDAQKRGVSTESVINERLASLTEMVGGYDFASVIAAYCKGHESGNDELQAAAIRWLRGEYATKTDARQALGVRTIVTDASVYDHLKLFGRFVRLADYAGLFVCLDELVNLFKLPSSQARKSNYEQILRILKADGEPQHPLGDPHLLAYFRRQAGIGGGAGMRHQAPRVAGGTMPQDPLNPDLAQFEQSLRTLTPHTEALDRDALIYRAGQASMQVRRSVPRWMPKC